MDPRVDPLARVAPGASLGPAVEVGPFAVVGPEVTLGAGTRLEAHAVVVGRTTLGENNRVGHHAVLGTAPQVRGLDGAGALELGRGNTVREFATVHAGTPGSVTRLGDDNLLMVSSHVAHDCRIGSGVELCNEVQLAGHVVVEDRAMLGGLSAVHQFARVGRFAFVAAGGMVSRDVPPFCLAGGDRARIYGINRVGLSRHGFPAELRRLLARAVRLLLEAETLALGLSRLRPLAEEADEVAQIVEFAAGSQRGLCAMVTAGHDD